MFNKKEEEDKDKDKNKNKEEDKEKEEIDKFNYEKASMIGSVGILLK